MNDIFGALDGDEIRRMRTKVEELSEVVKRDRDGGKSHEAVLRLSKFGQSE